MSREVLTGAHIIELRKYPNSLYYDMKVLFLYHSNKTEGSTFGLKELDLLLDKKIVSGSHSAEDVIETINSIDCFEYMIDTLGEPLSPNMILDFHRILKTHTRDHHYGQSGVWKKVPNSIRGSEVKLSEPWEVPIRIQELIDWWYNCEQSFEDIVNFHVRFEKIHPFLDGNGRVGRLIMLKQCFDSGVWPIVLDFEYSDSYKQSLGKAQLTGDQSELEEVLKKCQQRFADRDIVKDTLHSMRQMGLLDK